MAAAKATPDIATLGSDIAALKRDVAVMMRQLTGNPSNGAGTVRQAATRLGDEATALYEQIAAAGTNSHRALAHRVEERPATSLLIAFALGLLGGHLLLR